MTQARVLADRIIPGEGLAWDVARIGVGNLLLIVCAQLAVPLPWTPVPITGQTFGVLLVAALLGARRGAVVTGLYLIEGLLGLPVFQPYGLPGALRLAGPTAGYLIACPAAAGMTGWIVERARRMKDGGRLAGLVVALLAGETVIFVCGWAWLAKVYGMGTSAALAAGVTPFLAGELIKVSAVAATVRGTERVVEKK
jgi:biotin transport system substrate-specific component